MTQPATYNLINKDRETTLLEPSYLFLAPLSETESLFLQCTVTCRNPTPKPDEARAVDHCPPNQGTDANLVLSRGRLPAGYLLQRQHLILSTILKNIYY